jgi:hypothetical protein
MALLLKATYWHAAKRIDLFRRHPPAAVHPLTWRVDFDGRDAPTMDVCWNVWQTGTTGTRYEPIVRSVAEIGIMV